MCVYVYRAASVFQLLYQFTTDLVPNLLRNKQLAGRVRCLQDSVQEERARFSTALVRLREDKSVLSAMALQMNHEWKSAFSQLEAREKLAEQALEREKMKMVSALEDVIAKAVLLYADVC